MTSTRFAAIFGAGMLLGLVVGLAAAGGRPRAAEPAGTSATGNAQMATLALVVADRSDTSGTAGGVAAPTPPPSADENRRAVERADLPTGDPTARIVAEALRDAARPLVMRPAAGRGSTAEVDAGRISGRVQRPDGSPVAGAVVTLAPDAPLSAGVRIDPREPGSQHGTGDDDPTSLEAQLGQQVRDVVLRHARLLGSARRETTDARGAFAFAGVEAGTYTVRASVPGGRFEPERLSRYGVEPGGPELELLAVPAAGLRVDPRLPDGAPAFGAFVRAEGPSPHRWEWGPGAETAWLEPGTYVVTASLYVDDTQLTCAPATVIVGEEGASVTLALDAPPSIGGRITLEGGAPLDASYATSIVVWYARIPPGLDAKAALARTDLRRAGGSGGGGRYRVDEVGPGVWAIGAARAGEEPQRAETVEVGTGPATRDLTMPPLDEATVARLRILGPDGRPLRGAGAEVRSRFADGEEHVSSFSFERPGGLYVVPLDEEHRARLAAPRAPGDRIVVVATAPGIGAAQRPVANPMGVETVVQLGPAATLSVVFEGLLSDGHVRRASASLERAGDAAAPVDPVSGNSAVSAEVDALGRLFLGPVEAGAYDLHLSAEGQRGGDRRVLTRRVMLEPGENRLTIPAPPLGSIRIEGAPEGQAQLYRAVRDRRDGAQNLGREGATGALSADLLDPGTYVLLVDPGEGRRAAMVIRVAAGSATARFAPEAPGRLELVFVAEGEGDPEGPVAPGDALVAVDGRRIVDPLRVPIWRGFEPEPRDPDDPPPIELERGVHDHSDYPSPVLRVTLLRGARVVELVEGEAHGCPLDENRWLPYPR